MWYFLLDFRTVPTVWYFLLDFRTVPTVWYFLLDFRTVPTVWYLWYFILLSYIIHAVQQRNICKSRCILVDTLQQLKFCLGMKLLPRVNISHFHDPEQHFLVMPPATKCASASLLTIQPVTCIHHHVRHGEIFLSVNIGKVTTKDVISMLS